MATRQLKALIEKGNHEVGALNSLKVKTLAHGAIATEDMDNFLMGEVGFDTDGERTVSILTDSTKPGYIIASPEARYMGEELVDFYNAEGERVRLVVPEAQYTRFQTSAFKKADGVTEIKAGQVAYFNTTDKKYEIFEAGTEDAGFTGAATKFTVVESESDMEYLVGKEMVKLEVQ